MQFINKKNGLKAVNDRYAQDVCNQVADLVQNKLSDFIQKYYREYTPEQYERTRQFLNSLVKTEAELVGNKWVATVYIDTSIQYPSMWGSEHWNMGNTAYMANQSKHGDRTVSNARFYNDAYDAIMADQHLTSSLAAFIKEQGLQVQYKPL